jgi:hypothetical protein
MRGAAGWAWNARKLPEDAGRGKRKHRNKPPDADCEQGNPAINDAELCPALHPLLKNHTHDKWRFTSLLHLHNRAQ